MVASNGQIGAGSARWLLFRRFGLDASAGGGLARGYFTVMATACAPEFVAWLDVAPGPA